MRGRYSDGGGEEGEEALIPAGRGSAGAGGSGGPSVRSNRSNAHYYECANERLYEAYSELHCLAQGERVAAGGTRARRAANRRAPPANRRAAAVLCHPLQTLRSPLMRQQSWWLATRQTARARWWRR